MVNTENKATTGLDRVERKEIKDKAKEAFTFVSKGGDPRDLPNYLRVDRK